jgi:pilus assembly protein Flp/PilA
MNIVTIVMALVNPFVNAWDKKDDVLRRRDEMGASLVEYALLLALIAVVAIVALKFLGGSVSNTLNSVGNSLANTPTP